MAKVFFLAEVFAKGYVNVYTYMYNIVSSACFRSMFCSKGRMARATRNSLTFVRPNLKISHKCFSYQCWATCAAKEKPWGSLKLGNIFFLGGKMRSVSTCKNLEQP